MNIYDLISRAQKLRKETQLDSVSPDRVGGLHEDTLKYINEFQLLASSPSLHKAYASVSAMQSDKSPKSDLTGKPLKPGQLVVIVPANQTDATAGDVYRYDGPSGNTSAWTFVAKIGAVPADAELSATSTNPPQNKVVTEKLTELESEVNEVSYLGYTNAFTKKDIEEKGFYNNGGEWFPYSPTYSTKLIPIPLFGKSIKVVNASQASSITFWKNGEFIKGANVDNNSSISIPSDATHFRAGVFYGDENFALLVNHDEDVLLNIKNYTKANGRKLVCINYGSLTLSYNNRVITASLEVTGSYDVCFLFAESGQYISLPAFTKEVEVAAGAECCIYVDVSENTIAFTTNPKNLAEDDILIEYYYAGSYTPEIAMWTSPSVNKIGFAATYNLGFCSFANPQKIHEIEERIENISYSDNVPFAYSSKIFKKVGCIGDSYTSGHIQLPGGVVYKDNPQYSWPHYMSKITGSEWLNFGVSGSTAKSWINGGAKLAEVQAVGNKCQAYVIGLAINDSSKYPVGTIDDINTDADTYYAWYYKLIQAVINVNPSAKIFCNTCPYFGVSGINNAINTAVRDIVSYCRNNNQKVFLVDLASEKYMNTSYYLNPIFVSDKVNAHHSPIGYEFMAECYNKVLSDAINENVSLFQDVFLIPCDEENS